MFPPKRTVQGFLWKESASLLVDASTGIQRRWFSIDATHIHYFDPKRGDDGKKKGSILLSNILQVAIAETSYKGKFKFVVHTIDRKYNLYAESMEDRAKWMLTIQQHINIAISHNENVSDIKLAKANEDKLSHPDKIPSGAFKYANMNFAVNRPTFFQKRFFVLSAGLLSFFKQVNFYSSLPSCTLFLFLFNYVATTSYFLLSFSSFLLWVNIPHPPPLLSFLSNRTALSFLIPSSSSLSFFSFSSSSILPFPPRINQYKEKNFSFSFGFLCLIYRSIF